MFIGVISTQTYVQALFSARDSKTAAAGCVAAGLIVIPVGLPSVVIGMYMHAAHPEISAIDALPLYLCTYLPEWLGGVGIAGLLISSLGSIAGLALGIGTMISRDIFYKMLGMQDGQKTAVDQPVFSCGSNGMRGNICFSPAGFAGAVLELPVDGF